MGSLWRADETMKTGYKGQEGEKVVELFRGTREMAARSELARGGGD